MRIQVLEARENEIPVIDNLARFYVYDLSEYMGWNCPESGLFGCGDDDFWSNERNHFFIVRVDGELAGFAVIEKLGKDKDADYDVAGFFVLRKFRRKGVGKYVAHTLFDKFRGSWTVRQLVGNPSASEFWRKAICEYTSGNYEESPAYIDEHGWEMVRQQFSNI